MKRIALAFVLGVLTPIAIAAHLGGETVAQAGIRLAAIEQGFALAQRHWQFDATPEHEATQEKVAAVKQPVKRGAR